MFVSLWFIALMAVVTAAWYLAPPARRWQVALAASAGVYFVMEPRGLSVLMLCALAVWYAARRVGALRAAGRRPGAWLWLGIAAALMPLAALKYLSGWMAWGLAVPLGVSYYTLQLVGYLADVAKGKTAAEKNYFRVLCFAIFFLSITQGPFNRYGALMPQLEASGRFDRGRAWFGAQRMMWGYFQKLAVADRLAIVVTEIFDHYQTMDRSQLIFGVVGFGIQLYADFAGYTNIALGAGEILGLALPENFRLPYFAQSISEFWGRWHISLSGWLRDYIYIPLGGSRCSMARCCVNLMATFLVSGVWHGVGWQFLFWGALHGVYQVAERLLPKRLTAPSGHWPVRWLRRAMVFVLVDFAWLFFRAESLSQAWGYLAAIAANPGGRVFSNYWEIGLVDRLSLVLLFAGVLALLFVDILHAKGVQVRKSLAQKPVPVRWAVYQLMLWGFLFMGQFLSGGTGTFLYARF